MLVYLFVSNCKIYTIQGRRLGYTGEVEEGRKINPGGHTILLYTIINVHSFYIRLLEYKILF